MIVAILLCGMPNAHCGQSHILPAEEPVGLRHYETDNLCATARHHLLFDSFWRMAQALHTQLKGRMSVAMHVNFTGPGHPVQIRREISVRKVEGFFSTDNRTSIAEVCNTQPAKIN